MYKVLTLAGGYSKEREISLITAKSVIKELKKDNRYNILLTEPDGNFVKKLRKFKPDLVLNLLQLCNPKKVSIFFFGQNPTIHPLKFDY